MRSSPFLLPLLTLGLVATGTATAQVTAVPNSGCPGVAAPTTTGQPNLGQPFGAVCTPCNPNSISRVLLGTSRMPVALDPSLTCVANCTVDLDPLAQVAGSMWMLTVPTDPTFVGFCVRVQCACIDLSGSTPCVTISEAIDVCIQP